MARFLSTCEGIEMNNEDLHGKSWFSQVHEARLSTIKFVDWYKISHGHKISKSMSSWFTWVGHKILGI